MDEQPPADSYIFMRLSVLNPDISRIVSAEQSMNIPTILTVFLVLKPERSRTFSDEHPLNILNIYVAFEVSKPDTSRALSDEQPSNILNRGAAFEVSNPDTSRAVSDEQFLNIRDIPVTLEVSKSETSTDIRERQLRNILFISVTFFVLKPERSIYVSRSHSSNIECIFVTFADSALLRSIFSAFEPIKSSPQFSGRIVPFAAIMFFTFSFLLYSDTSSLSTFPCKVSVPVSMSNETVSPLCSSVAAVKMSEEKLGDCIAPNDITNAIKEANIFFRFIYLYLFSCP